MSAQGTEQTSGEGKLTTSGFASDTLALSQRDLAALSKGETLTFGALTVHLAAPVLRGDTSEILAADLDLLREALDESNPDWFKEALAEHTNPSGIVTARVCVPIRAAINEIRRLG